MEDAGKQAKGKTSMNYWPGTKIIKSQNNAFTDWKDGRSSKITNTKEWRNSQASTIQMAGTGSDRKKQFTIYSKAQAMK